MSEDMPKRIEIIFQDATDARGRWLPGAQGNAILDIPAEITKSGELHDNPMMVSAPVSRSYGLSLLASAEQRKNAIKEVF